MIRKIIKIDEEKCNGCGACVSACHEGAIGLVDGKAKLMRDDYCDGLGDCLPSCPTGAISFEQREAADYNEKAVMENRLKKHSIAHHGGCPGSKLSRIMHDHGSHTDIKAESRLSQWPVQIKLVPVGAPYFNGADLLIAADCTAFAYGSFHEDFIKGRITLIGCPKLDGIDYSEKLAAIISGNDIKSITAVRMQVPCCGGLVNAVSEAIRMSCKDLSLRTVIISPDGMIVGDR